MVNVIALVFAGILVAGVAVLIGCSNAGPSVSAAAAELDKLAPNYWNRAEARMSYSLIQAPSRVGPAWSPDQLPGGKPAKAPRKPLFQAPPRAAVAPLPEQSFDDDLLSLPGEGSDDPYGLWADSPSPLGRVA